MSEQAAKKGSVNPACLHACYQIKHPRMPVVWVSKTSALPLVVRFRNRITATSKTKKNKNKKSVLDNVFRNWSSTGSYWLLAILAQGITREIMVSYSCQSGNQHDSDKILSSITAGDYKVRRRGRVVAMTYQGPYKCGHYYGAMARAPKQRGTLPRYYEYSCQCMVWEKEPIGHKAWNHLLCHQLGMQAL